MPPADNSIPKITEDTPIYTCIPEFNRSNSQEVNRMESERYQQHNAMNKLLKSQYHQLEGNCSHNECLEKTHHTIESKELSQQIPTVTQSSFKK